MSQTLVIKRISAYLYFDPSRPLLRACACAWHLRICGLRPFLALNDLAKDSNGVVGLAAAQGETAQTALESRSEPSASLSQTVSQAITDRLGSSRNMMASTKSR